MADIFIRWSQQLADNQNLRELYYRGLHDFEPLEGADLVGFGILMQGMFRLCEEAYYRHLEGHLDARVWYGWEAAMNELSGYPGVQGWWRLRSHWFHEDFAKHINQLQQAAKPPRLYREPMKDE